MSFKDDEKLDISDSTVFHLEKRMNIITSLRNSFDKIRDIVQIAASSRPHIDPVHGVLSNNTAAFVHPK